jgi:DNA polymerase-3 subunit epsilon
MVLDTLGMARKQFPGSPANLDALCRRFAIDNTERTYHGALLDSELLAEVYLELLGGHQHGMSLLSGNKGNKAGAQSVIKDRPVRTPRPHEPSDAEQQSHAALLDKLSDPLWKKLG